jgi:hypothetical protein
MGLPELPISGGQTRPAIKWQTRILLICLALTAALLSKLLYSPTPPVNAQEILSFCAQLSIKPSVPEDFHARTSSDRYEEGTQATLIRNATIWTGGREGTEVVYGDVLLDKGLVKAVGYIPHHLMEDLSRNPNSVNVIDANGAWITPGIFDMHSHVGVFAVPSLDGESIHKY